MWNKWSKTALLLSPLLAVAGLVAWHLGWFQEEQVLRGYQLAVEVDGQRYATFGLLAGETAISERTGHFFCQIDDLDELVQLAQGDVQLKPGGDNPYLQGSVRYLAAQRYVRRTKHYRNAAQSDARYQVLDAQGQMVYRFIPDSDDPYARTLVNVGMVRSSGGRGSSVVEDEYLDATRLLREKFGVRLTFVKDEEAKLVTLSFKPVAQAQAPESPTP
ncbi:hypothetical protein [Pseudomonas sp. UBA6562]|uniref:hypothetical protein n=1 Tax=Pseudomonas sp. UBA6562 TaxID=1947332 RepID=UPI0025E2B80D|nr:hypothetical protein [Pseudomonas sp. UBA6562]